MLLAVEDIALACQGRIVLPPADSARMVCGTTWDSRSVAQDMLFVALVGQQVDGHAFCASAAEVGAAAVLVQHDLPAHDRDVLSRLGTAIVQVADTQQALADLAGSWRQRLAGTVLALTGSSGKTTTKNLVRDVLAAAGSVVATQANQNNELGVPATVLAAHEDTQFLVVEMGMRGLGQLEDLCSFVRPNWALVTNVGTSHLELLGSRDAIARAKAEPLAALPEDGVAFLNASGEYVSALREYGKLNSRAVETVFYDGSGALLADAGEAPNALVYATDVSFNVEGQPTFTLHLPGSSAEVHLRLAGAHNVHNALAAAAVGWKAGLSADVIAQALGASRPAAGRQDVRTSANGAHIVDDSYNANPDSMLASLATFAAMQVPGKRVAVLGDMLELGSFEEEGHALVGQRAATCGLDALVCVGQRAQGIARAATGAGMPQERITCVATASDALALLAGTVSEGDCVLVKASHSIGLDSVAEGLVSS